MVPTPISLIVGLGASAGGLKALEGFFSEVPSDSGCCFVVVQHLAPGIKSILGEILGRHTLLPIHQVEHGLALAPNAVFLMPPNYLLTIHDGHFILSERRDRPLAELPVNVFFRSLAAEAGARAVGVVLSGGGSDGADGVRAIREAGGLVVVQRPDLAEFDSMPQHALSGGPADHVLACEDMPAIILAYARDLACRGGPPPLRNSLERTPAAPAREPLEQIMLLLRRASGVDFAGYKIGTVERRIERRLGLHKLPSLAAYAQLLAGQPQELDALYHDLLIGVTEFFRDSATFDELRGKVLPGLLVEARVDEVRAWVPGCATGEEAYSLAILFDEVICATGFAGNFLIFATDVHRASLEFATAGLYRPERLKNVNAARRDRYFREEADGQFRVIPELRKRMVFAPHNLVSDPPFTRLDLVSCRNLLIYFDRTTQERVFRLLYFSLREGGCLFLGPSESLGQVDGVKFETVDDRLKFFRKVGGETRLPPLHRPQKSPRPAALPIPPAYPLTFGTTLNRQLLAAYDHILRKHVPAGLLVNEAFEILHYFGVASRYLAPLEGRAHESLLHRVQGDLRLCLSILLPRVFKSGEPATARAVRVQGAEGDERMDVIAEPIAEGRGPVSLVHLAFANPRPAPPPVFPETGPFVAGEELLRRVQDLEAELLSTKESLQTAVAELQASNEELQAGNEELTAANEELQSTNEELHAVNEELHTLNAEFERKNAELQVLNDDLNNLANSTDTGTIFIDLQLRIRKYNPAIQRIFRLLPQDLGRPIDHIAYLLDGHEQMLADVHEVLKHGQIRQEEVRTRDGRWLLKKVMPFLSAKGAREGVVLTFTDIDEIKVLGERLELAMTSSRLVWWEWDLQSGRIQVRGGKTCILGFAPGELPATGTSWEDATHPDDLLRVRAALRECLEGKISEWSCEHRLRAADGAWVWVLNSGKITERDARGQPLRMLGTTQDIRARHHAEELVHRDAEILSHIKEAIVCVSLDGIVTFWNSGAEALFRWTSAEMVGRNYFERFPSGPAREEARQRKEITLTEGQLRQEREDYRKDGSRVWVEAHASRINDGLGRLAGIIAIFHDISARKQAEQKRQQLEHQLFQAQKMETMGVLAGGIAHDFNNIIAAILGHTELALSRMPPDDPHRHYHEVVLGASHRARELVKRILAFSHANDPERKPVQLEELIVEAGKFVRAALPATVEMQLDLEKNCPRTLADANQIHQVLMNLTANAAHAMRAEGGRLSLRLRKLEFTTAHETAHGSLPAGTFLALEVADTGHGIPPDSLPKIFDPFFTTKPVGEGTGLGLSIVHGIMEGHGGAIDVSSTPGRGTTFTLYLPVAEPEAVETPRTAPAAVPRGQRQRVAVIDDEEVLARLAQATLQNLGYEAFCFCSAEQFYDEFSRGPSNIQLIVTDQTMPRLTGLQLVQRLRADGCLLPVLIVSGYSKNLTSETLSALGAVELLRKPYDAALLGSTVNRLLQKAPAGSTSKT